MIQLSAAGKRFGPKTLFQDLNWLVTPQDRVGLVGADGTGKTTLLKVLAGLESLDYGPRKLFGAIAGEVLRHRSMIGRFRIGQV